MSSTVHGVPISLLSSSSGTRLPSAFPGLQLWLAGDSALNAGGDYPDDVEAVVAWLNKWTAGASGPYVQGGAGQPPVFNAADASLGGRPSISFTAASNHNLQGSAWITSGMQDCTIVWVGHSMDVANGMIFCADGSNNPNARQFFVKLSNPATKMQPIFRDGRDPQVTLFAEKSSYGHDPGNVPLLFSGVIRRSVESGYGLEHELLPVGLI